jgi:hypothetical protein
VALIVQRYSETGTIERIHWMIETDAPVRDASKFVIKLFVKG